MSIKNIKLILSNDICINDIKNKGIHWVEELLEKELTLTKPGSLSYLLRGSKPSEQSINIKFGRFGEFISKYFNFITFSSTPFN